MSEQKKRGGGLLTIIALIVIATIGIGLGAWFGGMRNNNSAANTNTNQRVLVSNNGGTITQGNAPTTFQGTQVTATGDAPVFLTSADTTQSVDTAAQTTAGRQRTGTGMALGGASTANGNAVSGDGSLHAQDGVDVLTPAAVTIIQLPVKAGDEVVRGEVLARVDRDKLSTTLSDLKAQQTAQETTVKNLSGSKASSTIYSPVQGRLKKTYAEVGNDVRSVIDEYGALAMISTDGLMKVTFAPSSWTGLRPGAEVTVKNERGKSWDGRVAAMSEAQNEVTVTFTDNGPEIDEYVTVYLGAIIGSGAAQINAPLAVTGTGGIVDTVAKSENTSLTKGNSLFTLSNVPISDDYNAALTKRQDIIDQISAANAMIETGDIVAPESGIINAVYNNVTNAPLGKDTAILSLSSNERLDLVVSVDEMDVVKLKVGQSATATIPALGTGTFAGTVKKIASVGKIVGGIAMYDVTLSIDNAPGMRVAMSGSATINAG